MRELLTKRRMSIAPFDLEHAIEEAVRLVNADMARLQVTVACGLAHLPPVHGDRVHLQQAILNLVRNAVDAMSGIPASKRRLGIRTGRTAKGDMEVVVWDSGPGIDPAQAERLFDSFFTTKVEGMGLGPSIARSIVEAHGGKIWACNRAEGGAAFGFSLPSRPARSGATAA